MQRNDLSRSLVAFEQNSTLVAVIELSLKTWLVAGLVPGLARRPLKKQGADPDALLTLLHRWRSEAIKAGRGTQFDPDLVDVFLSQPVLERIDESMREANRPF